MNTLWVGLGGALGSIARYHVQRFATARAPAFPWGTLIVNLLGSFALSIVMQLVLRDRMSEPARIAVGVGVLGGFTTYSSFNAETIALVNAGRWGAAALYVTLTVVGCLAVGALGWLLGRGP